MPSPKPSERANHVGHHTGVSAAAAVALLLSAGIASADVIVLPNAWATQAGSGGNSRLLNNTPGVHQSVFAASQLSALPPGSQIEGIAWRQYAGATTPWPPSTVIFGEFNIQVSTSLNPPGSLSTTFNDNIGPDVVMVRSGELAFPGGSFPPSMSPPGYAGFGPVVQFTTPFIYQGGDLLFTMRRSGFISGSGSAFADRLLGGDPGWETEFQGHHIAGDINAPTSLFPAVFIFEISWSSPGPECYANCDGSTGEPILTVDDFTCFINEFAAAQALPHEQQISHYANCDGSTTAPVLTVDDFTCFINEFAAGCP